MTSTTRPRSVLLLHEQLQDARVWQPLRELIDGYATAHTVDVPPLHTLGGSAWTEHLERHALATIEHVAPGQGVDLVVTAGAAATAGVSLVDNAAAGAALLLNPDPAVLAGQARIRFDEQQFEDRLATFFGTISPYLDDLLAGTLGEDGIAALVEASLADLDQLTATDKALLRQVATEQLTAMQPMRPAESGPAAEPDWLTLIAPVADRCTVALSACGGVQDQLASVLRREQPTLNVIGVHSTSWFVWLHRPETVNSVIRDLLGNR